MWFCLNIQDKVYYRVHKLLYQGMFHQDKPLHNLLYEDMIQEDIEYM
jgi:hypothetical protein